MYGCVLHSPLNIGFSSGGFQEFKLRDDAAEALNFAAMYAKAYYDNKHENRYYAVGDKVYLRLHNGYSIPDSDISKKLRQQAVGPLKVLERVGKLAFRVELPPQLRIHDVISVAWLEPAPKEDDPFRRPYQPNPPPLSEHEDGADYEVDAILAKRTIRRGRKNILQYLVRWTGYGSQWNEWFDDTNLPNAREAIQEFEDRQAQITGRKEPPARDYPTDKPQAQKKGRPRKIKGVMAQIARHFRAF
jgi:chromodomain-containing protein